MLAPGGRPPGIVAKLHGEIGRILKQPEIYQRVADLGAEVIGNTPTEFITQVLREREKWSGVVKAAGIRPE